MEMEIEEVKITRIASKYNIEATSDGVKKVFGGIDELDVEGSTRFDSSSMHDTFVSCTGTLTIDEVETEKGVKRVGKIVCE